MAPLLPANNHAATNESTHELTHCENLGNTSSFSKDAAASQEVVLFDLGNNLDLDDRTSLTREDASGDKEIVLYHPGNSGSLDKSSSPPLNLEDANGDQKIVAYEERTDLPPNSKDYVAPSSSKDYVYVSSSSSLGEKVKRHFTALLSSLPLVSTWANKRLINKVAQFGKNRPFQFSAKADYTSLDSLMDYSYYARHLPSASDEYISSLPSLDDVETLFRRPNQMQTMCPKSTMLFPVFAQHLVDSFIITREKEREKAAKESETIDATAYVEFDWKRTNSPQEITLLPLYGKSTEQTDALRLNSEVQGERGRLKTQIIDGEEYAPFLYDSDGNVKAEFQDLDEPQGFTSLLAVHPSLAEQYKLKIFAFGGLRTNTTPQVAALNTLLLREHNRIAWVLDRENPEWDDERVFQTARNINVVLYLKLIIEEYVNHIVSSGFQFKVKPGKWLWNAPWYKRNMLSVEFAVLYRWHSLVPNTFDWNGNRFGIMQEVFNNSLMLQAGGLRETFIQISANRSTCFIPFNTSDALLTRERKSLEQSRVNRLRPYADYCEYLGMPRPKTFGDITSDPEVQDKLRKLYCTPDRVEFYVGLIAADPPPKYIFPEALTRFVAKDAFSQALTNPLLSENVFNEDTFTKYGWTLIHQKQTLKDLVERNTKGGPVEQFIGMTNPNWKLFELNE